MLRPMSAASIGIVPVPQNGSASTRPGRQKLSCTNGRGQRLAQLRFAHQPAVAALVQPDARRIERQHRHVVAQADLDRAPRPRLRQVLRVVRFLQPLRRSPALRSAGRPARSKAATDASGLARETPRPSAPIAPTAARPCRRTARQNRSPETSPCESARARPCGARDSRGRSRSRRRETAAARASPCGLRSRAPPARA